MVSLSYTFLCGPTTIHIIIKETCAAIWESLRPLVLAEPTESDWLEMEKDFSEKWNFPHCILCLDGKHVVLQVCMFYCIDIYMFIYKIKLII